MEVVAIIPARISSTRFPGKVLVPFLKKSILQHVYERVKVVDKIEQVYIATADTEIMKVAKGFSAPCIQTRKDHPSGTSRIAEAASYIDAEIIINVQADEPLISPELLNQLVETMLQEKEVKILTPIKKIEDEKEIKDPNIVKVVFDKNLDALYFSRLAIPSNGKEFYKHIGVYCFRRRILLNYPEMEESTLEKWERLEQLRFLWNGYKIKLFLTEYESLSIDTPQDLERLRRSYNF